SGGTTLYEITDHLGTVRALISSETGAMAGLKDYYPGGMPMPNRNLQDAEGYRYGYQGEFAETDEETGKPAFELRLYDPRINRWLTTDPAGQYASPYMAMGNNWMNGVDPDGGFFFGGYKLGENGEIERISDEGDDIGKDYLYIVENKVELNQGILFNGLNIEQNGLTSSILTDTQKLAYFISTNLYKELFGFGFEKSGNSYVRILPYKDADYVLSTDGAIDAEPMVVGMTAGAISFEEIIAAGNTKFLFHTHPL